jgi:hypothetical protein
MRSNFSRHDLFHPAHLLITGTVLIGGWLTLAPHPMQKSQANNHEISVQLYQKWAIKPGDRIAGRSIAGGLGDLSIALGGGKVLAPFDGEARRDKQGCVFLSGKTVPNYLFRLCGLDQPKLGELRKGETLGSGQMLHFATLRQQSNGTWAVVEPAKKVLEVALAN